MKTARNSTPSLTWEEILKHKFSFTTADLEQLLYKNENRQELHFAPHNKKPKFWKFFKKNPSGR